MIKLENDVLVFTFPQVHPETRLEISFQRTLRIPDNGEDHPLPPGLGKFPLRNVEDYAGRLPRSWAERGGAMLPMYQSEALWLSFHASSLDGYWDPWPFAVKVAAGGINAITGEEWTKGLNTDPQDYLPIPEQPWLDGFCVEKGIVRQFAAMPLGQGFTAEEQLTGRSDRGGLQIEVFPMKREAFERLFSPAPEGYEILQCAPDCVSGPAGMGLAPGGRMIQDISEDPFDVTDWETEAPSRCFVHMLNAEAWYGATGEPPPHKPFSAREYTEWGLPWFEYYSEGKTLEGSGKLAGLKSLAQAWDEKKQGLLPDNETIAPKNVIRLRAGLRPGQVREWRP